jgi:uncharacterized protein YneR
MSNNFYCGKCDFLALDRRDYTRHCKTKKHKTASFTCQYCKKNYKYRSGLSRHVQTCKKKFEFNLDDEGEKTMENTEITHHVGNEVASGDMTELINIIKEQQKQLSESHQLIEKVIKETVPRIGNNNNNISINVYLNEQCKNAMNLTDFVDDINVSLEDLAYTQKHGYIEGITNIFTKKLKDLSPSERPIHCSDTKRLQFYVKDDDEWTKDDQHIKLDKSLKEVKMKQIKQLKQWEDLNPGYLTDDALLNKWQLMVKEIIGPEDKKKNIQKNMNIIKKQIANTTFIPVKCALKNK